MFDMFCAIVMVANGYVMECFPIKQTDMYYCDDAAANVKITRYFDDDWFGHACTTQAEVSTWNIN